MGSAVSGEAFDWDAQLLADKHLFSVEIESDSKDDDAAGFPRRRKDCAEGIISDFMGCKTAWGLFSRGVERFPEEKCFGTREFIYDEKSDDKSIRRGDFRWLTFRQVNEMVQHTASGLLNLGLKKGDNIGIFSINRAEWIIASLAAYSQGLRVVALYDTLGDKAVEFIINHAELKLVFVSKDTYPKVVSELETLSTLQYIIQFDHLEALGNAHESMDLKVAEKISADSKLSVKGFSELLSLGKTDSKDFNPPDPEDLALIMYTSGTTGDPKGVMLSHGNIAGAASGIPGLKLGPDDRYLSYLPLAHIFETVVQGYCWANGVQIGFFSGNPKLLMDDLKTLQPTVFCGVPRVFERIYQKVMEGVKEKNWFVRQLFYAAYADQASKVRLGLRSSWADLILGSVKETIGLGKVKGILTGAAPCPPYLFEFLKIIFGCFIGQGYGLTETCASLSVCVPEDYTVGSVGPPNCWAEIRLKSIPEMGYLTTDNPPRGEVQCRGAGVFKGYFKNPEATRDTFDGEWFATGDVGRWNPNGTLSIIDRKKNIFKLSQGEYVAVEKIENVYKQCSLINQVFVYGNSFKSVLVAIVVPNAENILKVAEEKGLWKTKAKFGSLEFANEFQSIVNDNRSYFTKLILEEMKSFEGPLKGFEKVKGIWIESRIDQLGNAFTVENDLMTPSFKLKRPQLLKTYLEQIKSLYTDAGEPPKPEEKWTK